MLLIKFPHILKRQIEGLSGPSSLKLKDPPKQTLRHKFKETVITRVRKCYLFLNQHNTSYIADQGIWIFGSD